MAVRPAVSRTMGARALLLAELLLATIVAACGLNLPPVPLAPFGNEPVPLPADLRDTLEGSGPALQAADGTSPPISASKALEIAGAHLLVDLSGNNVPAQDPSAPDGLVRRLFIERERVGVARPPTSVWVVAFRWDAGFNCLDPHGGPGPCDATSFYFIDDRTGEVVYGLTATD